MKCRSVNYLLVLLGVLVLFVGCRTVPVFNVEKAAINTADQKEPTMEEVTKAILSAAANSHPPWNMKVVKPGHIVATLHNRRHMAQVDINYTTKEYSITRKSSAELKYDPEKETIHSSYNKWIQRLDSNIQIKLNTL